MFGSSKQKLYMPLVTSEDVREDKIESLHSEIESSRAKGIKHTLIYAFVCLAIASTSGIVGFYVGQYRTSATSLPAFISEFRVCLVLHEHQLIPK
jgi:hypothetical protein